MGTKDLDGPPRSTLELHDHGVDPDQQGRRQEPDVLLVWLRVGHLQLEGTDAQVALRVEAEDPDGSTAVEGKRVVRFIH
jgi:hypothetical protein